ncbi:alpha/beta hydrolase [Streptomyces sp. NPDC049577]|uniref:alpha/beta fold hydrolase n=1 Tax=Streptomyces sp. NPDC049577 TaxID=3155153 RepID=UPI003430C645
MVQHRHQQAYELVPDAGEAGVWRAGPDDGVPLVLVHGIRLSARMWGPHVARLAPRFRVTAPDLPGHGALSERRFSLEEAVERVDAAVAEATAATGRRPLLAGTSLGGYVALAYGAEHPERVAALLVNGATSRPDRLTRAVYRTAARATAALGPERADRFNAWVLRHRLPPESHRAVMAGGMALRSVTDVVRDLTRRDFLAVAARCRAPLLLVNGRDDRLFRSQERAFLRAAGRASPYVRLFHVDGPHILALTDPAAFARVLLIGYEHLSRAVPEAFALPGEAA